MTKGIRQYVEGRFNKLLPKLADMGGTGFRQKIIADTVAQFDTSVASAAAAYNHVLGVMREQNPKAVAGLGRTEAGLNVVVAQRGQRPRLVAKSATKTTSGNVTLVRARDGETVVADIPRPLAQTLVDNSGSGRGNPKLLIQQDQEEEEAA